MNRFGICAVQDLSHILSAKSLKHEISTLASTNTFKRCFWSFLVASYKEENARKTKKINLLTVSYDSEPIPAAWITLNFRLPMTYLHSEINTEVNRLEALQPLVKYNDLLSLLDKNSSKTKRHTILPNVLIDDFGFVCDNNKVAIDKTDYRHQILTIFSTHKKNQASLIDLWIEQAQTNNSSACITAKNANNISLVESQFIKPKVNQQHSETEFKSQNNQFSQKRNLSQFSELSFQDVKRQDFRYIKQQQTIVYFTSSRNRRSQKLSSYLTSMPCRVFSTKSCIVIQKSAGTTSRKDLNVSSIRLKSAQSHSGCVSLVRLQSFSHDATKLEKSADCKEDRRRCDFKIKKCSTHSKDTTKKNCEKSNVKVHKKARSRQETRNEKNSPSQNDISKKRQKNESESCERYVCPQLKRKLKCWSEQHPNDKNCDSKGRDTTKNHARQSKDSKILQKQDNDTIHKKKLRLPTCERRETREEARVICTDPSKKKNNCGRESNHKKDHENREKRQQRCTENNREQSKSYQKRDSSYDRNKIDGKRHYSQQSTFSVSRYHRSFSTLIPDIVLGTNVARRTTHRFYASCSNGEKESKPSFDKKDEVKKKCVKDQPKCLTKKSIPDKEDSCQSTSKDKDTNSHKPTQKSSHEEYCSNRKEAMKDKKPVDKSIQEQIDREYKEIEECKKTGKEIKKDDKKTDKIKKMSAKSIARNFTDATHKSLREILNEILIIPRDVRLFDIMFDRSFSTTKVNYQDDFAIERTAGHSKMAQRCSANNSEFIHGDELPSYVEIENDEEEDDEFDWITARPILGLD